VSPRPEETVKDALNVVDVILLDVSTNLETIAKHFFSNTVHRTELPAQIRQVFHFPGLPGWLRRTRRATGTAKQVTQDLAEDVAARRLRTGRHRFALPARHGDLDRTALPAGQRNLNGSASDDDRFDAPFLNALLQAPAGFDREHLHPE
jgi:hypothetical protein